MKSMALSEIPLNLFPVTVMFTCETGGIIHMQTVRGPWEGVDIPCLQGPTTLTMDYADGATYEKIVCQ